MPRHAAPRRPRRLAWAIPSMLLVAGTAAAIGLALTAGKGAPFSDARDGQLASGTTSSSATTTSSSTTTIPASTTTTLPPPGPGFVPGHVTAVGDSVMIDYQEPLAADIPGVLVQAAVSRQWGTGETLLQQDKAAGQLGAEVIVGLGTNGPITAADFDSMMQVLGGASRVVFVNFHVDRPWQDPNNAVLAQGAMQFHNVVIADWATLAAQHPEWFGADGTHLAINGTGAHALAALIASALSQG